LEVDFERRKEMRDFLLPRKQLKKKSRSDEESFLLFFFFFFSRGEKARARQSSDKRGCFFARFLLPRVDHRLLDDDHPRARERKSIPLDDDDDLCVSSWRFCYL
jgi:hypothetical protein